MQKNNESAGFDFRQGENRTVISGLNAGAE